MRYPWKKVMSNVRLSAAYGSAGGRHIGDLKRGGYSDEEIEEIVNTRYRGNKEVSIDHTYLEGLFYEQNGRCAYLKTIIDPIDVFIPNHPLAPSVDRIDNSLGYIRDNVVIATRFANRGKETAEDTWFRTHCVPRLADGLINNSILPNLENF